VDWMERAGGEGVGRKVGKAMYATCEARLASSPPTSKGGATSDLLLANHSSC
jgi:hypothetical protein